MLSSAAGAQLDTLLRPEGSTFPTDAQQARRWVAPFVRAATDCVAREVLNQPGVVEAYRQNDWSVVVLNSTTPCSAPINEMIAAYDRYYGLGSGAAFYNGPYLNDLPRTIVGRIRPEVERRMSSREPVEVERRVERQPELERARDLLRSRFYACARTEVAKLVSSNESSEVLTTAAMTLCRRELDGAAAANVDAYRARFGASGEAYEQDTIQEFRDGVITIAVQARAAAAVGGRGNASRFTDVAAGEKRALARCLRNVTRAREEKIRPASNATEAMLDLCRPEIETLARTRFLADPKIGLDAARLDALRTARSEAIQLIRN